MRRCGSLPLVNDPLLHVLQCSDPAALYFASSSHERHAWLPLTAEVPASHSTTVLLPEQALPVWHCVHALRCAASVPVVNEPLPHVRQLAASVVLYLLSAPHALHSVLPAAA